MATIDALKKVRLGKLKALKKLGVDPYPAVVERKESIRSVRDMQKGDVAVAGRIMGLRAHGKIVFVDLRDETERIQVVLKADGLIPEALALLDYLDIGDFLAARGTVGKTQSGELSVFASNIQLLSKAIRPLPDAWYGLKDVEERYRKRYLDILLNPEVKKRLETRSRVIDAIRDFLTNREFLEVETPTLQPIYGGGLARPFVTHHNVLDTDFYLRISDEMYLKRLIVAGFEKVFEITKVFRNEGVDRNHNPEFTMFEAQIAYQDYFYGMDITEELIEYVARQVLGSTKFTYQGLEMDVRRPWPRHRLVEAVHKFTGVDPLVWKRVGEAKEAIQAMEGIPEAKLGLLAKLQSLGESMVFAFDEAVQPKIVAPTIVYDYPIEVSPLAKKCEDPRFAQRFEVFAAGSELGNNYTELNDPQDLKTRFAEEKKRAQAGVVEAHQTDSDYLEAIEHGFPPTCGLGIGIDRLVMLLSDAKSIKEVIPFPLMKKEK